MLTEFKDFAYKNSLITLRMDLINKCNFRCTMCHYSDEGIRKRSISKIDLDTFKSKFYGIMPYVGEVVLSCGDEPLMSPDFSNILEYISSFEKTIDISFCTNGSLLNSEMRSILIKYGVTYLMFSIDGVKKCTFEKIRIGSSYEKVIGNFKAMAKLKDFYNAEFPRITLNYVLLKSNLHESVGLLHIAKDLKADLVDFRHAVPSQFWNDPTEILENSKALFNFYRTKILETAALLELDVLIPDTYNLVESEVFSDDLCVDLLEDYYSVKPSPPSTSLVKPKLFPKSFRSRSDPQSKLKSICKNYYCERPFTEIMIKQQDGIAPCPWYTDTLGSLKKGDKIYDVFFGEDFNKLRISMLKGKPGSGCLSCPIKSNHLPIS